MTCKFYENNNECKNFAPASNPFHGCLFKSIKFGECRRSLIDSLLKNIEKMEKDYWNVYDKEMNREYTPNY